VVWLSWIDGAFTFCLAVLLDGLWPFWDARRRALHDEAGGTVVVRAD
jgi:uncharacterized RDD family membrane protein YckC